MSDKPKQHHRRKGLRGKVAARAMYYCQAEGLHDDNCPGRSSIWAEGIRGVPWNRFARHHKNKRAWGGNDEPDNLMWVFKACHTNIHKNESRAHELGLLDSPPDGQKLIG